MGSLDPFAPPASDLLARPDATGVVRRTQVDIVAAMRYPFDAPNWPLNTLLMGLLAPVPIVGFLTLFGLQKRLFGAVAAGRESDPPDGLRLEDLGGGVQPFFAFFLNMFILVMGMMLICGVPIGLAIAVAESGAAGAAGQIGSALVMLASYALTMALSVGINVLMPELMRRVFRGEWAPLLRPGPSIAAARRNPAALVMTILGMFMINMIAGIGVFFCYVGIFITMPLAQVALAHLYGQWAAVVGEDDAR